MWISLRITDYRTAESIMHHFLTATLAFFSLYPYCHYYGTFFLGLAELVVVPLNVVEACEVLGDTGPAYKISQALFALGFIIVRVVWWPIVSYAFWKHSLQTLQSDDNNGPLCI